MEKTELSNLRISIAQINPVTGDLYGNTDIIIEYINKAKALKVDLLIFPELALSGSPPQHAFLNSKFINDNVDCLQSIIKYSQNIAIVLGCTDFYYGLLHNAAAIIIDNKLVAMSHKQHLSKLPFLDEKECFYSGTGNLKTVINGFGVEISIGDDILNTVGPVNSCSSTLPRLLISINANFSQIKDIYSQEDSLSQKAAKNDVFIASANLVGSQDELVFPGSSFIMNNYGKVLARGKPFEEDIIVADLNTETRSFSETPVNRSPKINYITAVYSSLVLGLRDYVKKSGFSSVTLGLSGGIDSSLVATLAVDALGAENVMGVSMPSRYSSLHSRTDVDKLVSNLGIKLDVIPIEKAFCAFVDMLNLNIDDGHSTITEQNLQARIRANILYALSNKYGWMVLCCSNKSESATGYGTLYGDIAGGFAVLKNIYKTMVFELAKYRNSISEREIIPNNIMIKEPSAELAPNQKDTDTLPPYDILDPVLQAYMDSNISVNEIVDMGYDKNIVDKVVQLVEKNEYKRRQSPPGVILLSGGMMK